ncbi:MAG: PKD domain-containing protein, partial [Putridiphycobacter sp.]|nr:PKD domain-containing protein [Putridiphycobacter sp.]
SIIEWKSYELLTGDTLANFTTFNYCPNTVPTTCNAYFDIAQAAGPNGNLLPGSLVVTDSSTSSNPAAVLTYTWDFGDSTTGTGTILTHTYTGNGPYLLCLTIDDGLGCTDTYCDTVSVDSLGMIESEGFTLYIGGEPALGIDHSISSPAVNIYPNPAIDFLNIAYDSDNKTLNRITIFDLSGKMVYENNNVSDKMTVISTENIEPGTYLVKMLFENEVYNRKVIIK